MTLKSFIQQYAKSPIYEPSSCKLSKMQTCVGISNHVSQFPCLSYIVMCMHPLKLVVIVCTLLYSTIQSTVVVSLLFRPWDSPGKNTGVGCHFLLQCIRVKSESEVAQSCPTSQSHGLQPTRLLHTWDFPGKSTGVGYHCLLRGHSEATAKEVKIQLILLRSTSCYNVLLYFSRYFTIRLKMFSLSFCFYALFL